MRRFKNLIVVIDRSTEHESRRGFTVPALVGIWDSETGPLKGVVFNELNPKHAKKYGNTKKAKMDMQKAALKGEHTNLPDHIHFTRNLQDSCDRQNPARKTPKRFYGDFKKQDNSKTVQTPNASRGQHCVLCENCMP